MTACAIERIADVVRQQFLGLQVQAHTADHLIGVGGGEQVGQARGLEGSRISGLRIELRAQLFHLFRGDR
ncbi:hypothetical protein D3C79_896670 [compost metagenome]